MTISRTQVQEIITEVMASVENARRAGYPCMKPNSILFIFPVKDVAGATVQFELHLDWYAGADEASLW